MTSKKPLVDKTYKLEKFPGKGGWTFAAIPEVIQDKSKPFGWVTVRGSIDGVELKHYKLMPMGNGKLFLPVKAEIRKKIGKGAGDTVHVILFADDSALEVPNDIRECLKNESREIQRTFDSFPEGERKYYVDWVAQAKTEEKRAERIVELIRRLERKLKFHD